MIRYTKEELLAHVGKNIRFVKHNIIIEDAKLSYDVIYGGVELFFICSNVFDGMNDPSNKYGYDYAWSFHYFSYYDQNVQECQTLELL